MRGTGTSGSGLQPFRLPDVSQASATPAARGRGALSVLSVLGVLLVSCLLAAGLGLRPAPRLSALSEAPGPLAETAAPAEVHPAAAEPGIWAPVWSLPVDTLAGTPEPAPGPPAPVGVPTPPATGEPGQDPAGPVVAPAVARSVLSASGVPAVALAAYQRAEARLGTAAPGCHLSWPVLAAIGQVESSHGTFGGAQLGTDGVSRPPILGIALDGSNGTGLIRDTDAGRLDHDTVFDRAVGPMQFIPGTWVSIGADGNGDGISDPQNSYDAALAAGLYLCAGGRDLAVPTDLEQAVFSYNHSSAYVTIVLALAAEYAGAPVQVLPAGTGAPGPDPAPLPPLPVDPVVLPAPQEPPADGGGDPLGLGTAPPAPSPAPAALAPPGQPTPTPGHLPSCPTRTASPGPTARPTSPRPPSGGPPTPVPSASTPVSSGPASPGPATSEPATPGAAGDPALVASPAVPTAEDGEGGPRGTFDPAPPATDAPPPAAGAAASAPPPTPQPIPGPTASAPSTPLPSLPTPSPSRAAPTHPPAQPGCG